MDTSDSDLDMKRLLVWEYYPANSATPHRGPLTFALTSQEEANVTYVLNGVAQIEAPAGQWRMDFKVEDQDGNQSNTYTRCVTVTY